MNDFFVKPQVRKFHHRMTLEEAENLLQRAKSGDALIMADHPSIKRGASFVVDVEHSEFPDHFLITVEKWGSTH